MDALIKKARQAIAHSYSPYSEFAVAAVVRDGEGNIHCGVNVENASYGLTQCAERSAICTAVSAGATSIDMVLIYTPTAQPNTPCGACLQVIQEFAENVTIVCVCDSAETITASITDLLPQAFQL